jgi:hypothetical protein
MNCRRVVVLEGGISEVFAGWDSSKRMSNRRNHGAKPHVPFDQNFRDYSAMAAHGV